MPVLLSAWVVESPGFGVAGRLLLRRRDRSACSVRSGRSASPRRRCDRERRPADVLATVSAPPFSSMKVSTSWSLPAGLSSSRDLFTVTWMASCPPTASSRSSRETDSVASRARRCRAPSGVLAAQAACRSRRRSPRRGRAQARRQELACARLDERADGDEVGRREELRRRRGVEASIPPRSGRAAWTRVVAALASKCRAGRRLAGRHRPRQHPFLQLVRTPSRVRRPRRRARTRSHAPRRSRSPCRRPRPPHEPFGTSSTT